jgi:hypothetical protein
MSRRDDPIKECLTLVLSYQMQHGSKDPIMLLVEHYQKKGIAASLITDAFEAVQYTGNKKELLWKFVFTCPMTRVQVSSALPAPLLLLDTTTTNYANDDSIEKLRSELEQQPKVLFGFWLIREGTVYFLKKQAAKRSCALAMLLVLSQTNGLFASQQPLHQQDSVSEPTTTMNCSSKHYKKIPKWVDRLYGLGVDHVAISYEEQQQEEQCADWTGGEPTLLVCNLSVTDDLHVSSQPCISKSEARNQAIDVLQMELIRNGMDRVDQFEESRNDAFAIKVKLRDSDAHKATYTWPLSSCLMQPFNSGGHRCFLYELVLTTPSKTSLVAQRMKLRPECCTRIGIVFPKSITIISKRGYQTSFTVNNQTVQAELCNQTVLCLTKETFDELKRFNRGLSEWKTYDRTTAFQLERDEDFAGRTCLFVPLERTTLDDKQKLAVNWVIVQDQLNNVRSPYMSLGHTMSRDELSNRFLVHNRGLYMCAPSSTSATPKTASSRFHIPADHDSKRTEDILQKYGLDLSNATYADYFEKR